LKYCARAEITIKRHTLFIVISALAQYFKDMNE